ncbi:MAG: permease [Pirellulales bacterium]
MDHIFWGGLQRFGEAILAAAPTVIVGLLVAAIFRYGLGANSVYRLFGGHSWRSLPQAWLWGMLLPVCSIGVIPVARELRRAGLPGGTVLAFALTAPLFNPLSLLYGLSLSVPLAIVTFALASLAVVTVVGWTWDRLFPETIGPSDRAVPIQPGLRRVAAVAWSVLQTASGTLLVYLLVGAAGNLVLGVVLPKGCLGNALAAGDWRAPLQMAAIAIPVYATPLTVMQQIGSMFTHGNSIAAAYVLLSLGTGTNLGLLAWAGREYGMSRAAAFLVLVLVVVLPLAYLMEPSLRTEGNVDHPHSHAFDGYSAPFAVGQAGMADAVHGKLIRHSLLHERWALIALACTSAAGFVLCRSSASDWITKWITAWPADEASGLQSVMNRQLSPITIGMTAAVGGVVLSLVGCFVYFPSPSETLEDMRIVKADALSAAVSGDIDETVRHIERYDDLTRRLQVGYYLRNLELDEYQRLRAKALRDHLEQLKDSVQAGQLDRVPDLRLQITDAHRRVRSSFSHHTARDH